MSGVDAAGVVAEIRALAERASGGARFYRHLDGPSTALASLATDLDSLAAALAAAPATPQDQP